jgi:phage terminase small subunit
VAVKKTKGKPGKRKNKKGEIPQKFSVDAPKNTSTADQKPQNTEQKSSYDDILKTLKPQHARFVEEYLIDLNGQKAATRAGYKEANARKQASALLTKKDIRAAVDAGKAEISKRIRINQDEVIRQLVKIGFAEMGAYAKWGPGFVEIKKSEDLTEDQRCAVAEIVETTTEKGSSVRLKLHNSISALLGILDRVKPGADDPQKIEITHKMTYFPPEPKTMAEYEEIVKKGKV